MAPQTPHPCRRLRQTLPVDPGTPRTCLLSQRVLCGLQFPSNAQGLGRSWEEKGASSHGRESTGTRPDRLPERTGASYSRPFLPVGHVVEVLRELGQVWALLLILLFCPKQNLRNLKEEGDWMEPEPSGFLASFSCCAASSSCSSRGRGQPSPQPPALLHRIPLFCKRAQHPAGSAARLFHGCESHAKSPA